MARKCLSCKETAEKAGVDEKTAKNMLEGRRVSIKTFGLICCEALEVDPAEVVADEQGT